MGRFGSFLLTFSILATPIQGLAQGWDATSLARGWTRQDKDDSFTFYDEFSAALQTWGLETGLQTSTPLGRMPVVPEKWVIDPHGGHWVISGETLIHVASSGAILKSSYLPAPVADVCWDIEGFLLSYQTVSPYLEKRSYGDGKIMWAFHPGEGEQAHASASNTHPAALDESGHVLLGNGADLNLTIIDAHAGKSLDETRLLYDGKPVPRLTGVDPDRGPMCYWSQKASVLAALKAEQLPPSVRNGMQGLVLGVIDPKMNMIRFISTGITNQSLLVGVLNGSAVFVKPEGGLQQVPLR